MYSIPRTCSCIYVIQNLVNHKVYIGSAVDVLERWHTHKTKLRSGKHPNKHLSGAWKQYGEKMFCFYILEIVDDTNLLVEREQFWLDLYRSNDPANGYNLRLIANSNLGIKFSQEVRNKLSLLRMGNTNVRGAKQSKETIEKRRQKLIGQKRKSRSTPVTDEERRRRSIASRWKEGRKPVPPSEATKQKLSDAMRRIKGVHYEGFVSPDGIEYPVVENLKQFCLEHGLCWSGMVALYKGQYNSHRGWTIKGRVSQRKLTQRQLDAIPRQDAALMLRDRGLTFVQIAKELGYKDDTCASAAYKAALARKAKSE